MPMKLNLSRNRSMARFVTRLGNGNTIRLAVLSGLVLIAAAGTLVTSCRSRKAPEAKQKPQPTAEAALVKPAESQVQTPPVATADDGFATGIEAWQDNQLVTELATGKPVVFKPRSSTRDPDAVEGCEQYRGIVQSSWAIGSKPAVDIQRFAGQDCRDFDFGGMFTKPGTITVQLNVISAEGTQAQATATYAVKGDEVALPGGESGH
jgi:hypothetical protein